MMDLWPEKQKPLSGAFELITVLAGFTSNLAIITNETLENKHGNILPLTITKLYIKIAIITYYRG